MLCANGWGNSQINDFTLVLSTIWSLSTSLSVPSSVSSSLRASSVPLTLTAVIPTSLADLTLRPRSSRNTTYTTTTRRSTVKPFFQALKTLRIHNSMQGVQLGVCECECVIPQMVVPQVCGRRGDILVGWVYECPTDMTGAPGRSDC